MYSHIKLIDIRNKVRQIKRQEGTWKKEHDSIEDEVNHILRESTKKKASGDMRVNDDFMLPYNVGFDHIIKEKADHVSNLK
jgi:hypothetical protein